MERLDKMFSKDLLNKVKEILDEGKKQVDEAVEVSHTRYLRSHGKKASGSGAWMFTHKLYGDSKGDDTFVAPSSAKSFSDATKHAKEWAKSKGHRTVYVMEEVELDERNIENKFKKDLYVAKKGKEEMGKGINFAKYDKYRIADTKGHDYGIEYSDDDDASERHASRKSALRSYKVLGRTAMKKEEAEQIDKVDDLDEAAFDAASKANDRHYEKQTERVKNMLDKYAMRGMSYRDAVKKISGPGHILRNEITPLREEAEDLDEGRGRPPKEGSEAWKRRQAAVEKGEDEGESEHIIASLRKASHNMTGRGAVKFKSGIEMVDREHARRAVSKYMDHRTPDEKDEYLDKISHSYGHLKKNI